MPVVARQPRILCASASTCADVLSGDVMRSAVAPFNTARNPPAVYAASPSPDTFVAVGTAASPAANVEAVSSWNTTLIGIAAAAAVSTRSAERLRRSRRRADVRTQRPVHDRSGWALARKRAARNRRGAAAPSRSSMMEQWPSTWRPTSHTRREASASRPPRTRPIDARVDRSSGRGECCGRWRRSGMWAP